MTPVMLSSDRITMANEVGTIRNSIRILYKRLVKARITAHKRVKASHEIIVWVNLKP